MCFLNSVPHHFSGLPRRLTAQLARRRRSKTRRTVGFKRGKLRLGGGTVGSTKSQHRRRKKGPCRVHGTKTPTTFALLPYRAEEQRVGRRPLTGFGRPHVLRHLADPTETFKLKLGRRSPLPSTCVTEEKKSNNKQTK